MTLAHAGLLVAAAIRSSTPVGAVARGDHTCAVMVDTSVRCWGANESGQLGVGDSNDRYWAAPVPGVRASWSPLLPSLLPGPPEPRADLLALGDDFACFTNGGWIGDGPTASFQCVGDGSVGQMGDGLGIGRDRALPPTFSGQGVPVAGGRHACWSTQGSPPQCWGSNADGQLGDGNVGGATATPVNVIGPSDSGGGTLAAGRAHTCWSVAGEADIWCWGANDHGQLGDGSTTRRPTPVRVSGGVSGSISAGGDHTCALVADGSVWCWGANDHGQLGDGTLTSSSVPVRAVGVTGAVAVVAGSEHTCAIVEGAALWCWGRGTEGQLGEGRLTDQPTPALLPQFAGTTSVALGARHSCMVIRPAVYCVGANDRGQLGARGDSSLGQALTVVKREL